MAKMNNIYVKISYCSIQNRIYVIIQLMLFVEVKITVSVLNITELSYLGKGILRRPSNFSSGTLINSSYIMVYGSELRPECPEDLFNVLIADKRYCNVFYHCQSGYGSVYMCREGTVYDSSIEKHVGSCRSEEIVNCDNRLILTSHGTRLPTISKKIPRMNSFGLRSNGKLLNRRNFQSKYSNFILLPPPVLNQKLVLDVSFDCRGRIDGHWRDTRYCDVFHACIAGEQKRSYGCNQIGERFYFDDASQK